MNDLILTAISSSQRAQRNYDLTKYITKKDLDTLIYAAAKSPSKQNESHYSLLIYTDQDIIRKIYNNTKKFTLIRDDSDRKSAYGEKDGIFWSNETQCVTNSQILANVLFVYVDEDGEARGGTHNMAKKNPNGNSAKMYSDQKTFSIGISVGELILTANLLGYKTGICSAMDSISIKKLLNLEQNVRLLVGVGYENNQVDRRLHQEVLNKDVPEKFRTGDPGEYWRFPSFEKYTKVFVNGNPYT